MGQKIHPTGFRLAVTRNWTSKWFANSKSFAPTLKEDIKIREYLKKKLGHASVGKITIERPAKNARITIYSARPGVVIGKKGEDIETLRTDLRRMMGGDVGLNIEEIRKPEIDAQLISDSIAQQLEKRIMFRRAMKRAMQNAMRLGAQGIKIMCAGRLNGIEIARTEWYREGPGAAAHAARRHRLRLLGSAHDLRRHRDQGVGVQGRSARAQRRARCGPGARGAEAAAPLGRTRSEKCCSQLEGSTARSRRVATRVWRPSATR
jgi:ribosomal protein S3